MNILDNLNDLMQNVIKELNDNMREQKTNNKYLNNTELELAEKLDAIEIFAIDRIEGNIAVLENRQTGKNENIDIKNLPEKIKEGNILRKINGKYFIDNEKMKEIQERIEKKTKDIWK